MIRIAICDDSAEYLSHISQLISANVADAVCLEYTNGYDLVTAHNASPFDIILLDIVMPNINGIETAGEIRKNDKNVKIVFLTSSAEYAVQSYSVKADGYLLKPVEPEALYKCIDDIVQQLSAESPSIVVKGLYSVHRIPLDTIMYLEAQNKHILFALRDGTTVKTTEPLHEWETKLNENLGYFRCHRSYIVNMQYIATYTHKEITMRSGCIIPISRSCHKEFETAFFRTIFGSAGD